MSSSGCVGVRKAKLPATLRTNSVGRQNAKSALIQLDFFASGPKNKLDLKGSVLRDSDDASLRRSNTLIYLSIL
jgi:hypothetical protein